VRIGRRLAFDFGDVRIGVAVCDSDGILSSPLDFLLAKDPSLNQQIKVLIDEYEPTKIYIGLPLNLSGQESESSTKARAFEVRINALTNIPTELIDERLSTVNALKTLKEVGIDAKRAKTLIDSMAAVAILELGLKRDRQ
jgi:putative Holliday junction resolvase